MKKHSLESLLPELKKVTLLLKIYTILHIVIFMLSILNIIDLSYYTIIAIQLIFNFFFLRFLWTKLPISRDDKIGETILIILFGLFALWMWIPDKKDLKEMIEKYHSKT